MTTDDKTKELPFEKVMARLEKIVDEMETGNLSLESLVKKFEEGAKLSTMCREKLQSLEQKIELLASDNGTHPPTWKPIETEGNVASAPQSARKNASIAVAAEPNENLPF